MLRRAGVCCLVVLLVCGVAWTLSPWWGVFTDRLPVAVAWLLPAAQSTWPTGFAVAVVAAVAVVWLRCRRAVAVGATVAAVLVCAATVLVPGVLGRAASGTPGAKAEGTVRILSVNTWYHQASDAALAAMAREMDADVVVLAETSAAEVAAVEAATGLQSVLPTSTRTRGGGTALLVRPSWTVDGSVADLHLTRHQNPVAELENFTMTGVHTNAPAYSDLVGGWVTEMDDLRTWAASVDGPLVMAGDFNATAAHPELRRLMTGLTDCTGGPGVADGLLAAPTWPRAGNIPVPVLRLDHILVRGLTCADGGVVGVPGSDHAGIWADLRW